MRGNVSEIFGVIQANRVKKGKKGMKCLNEENSERKRKTLDGGERERGDSTKKGNEKRKAFTTVEKWDLVVSWGKG